MMEYRLIHSLSHLLTSYVIISAVICTLVVSHVTAEDPEIHMSSPQIIRHWGYQAEEHFPITEDGYILGMHRIPRGKRNSEPLNRPPVLLMHGLMSSSSCWI